MRSCYTYPLDACDPTEWDPLQAHMRRHASTALEATNDTRRSLRNRVGTLISGWRDRAQSRRFACGGNEHLLRDIGVNPEWMDDPAKRSDWFFRARAGGE